MLFNKMRSAITPHLLDKVHRHPFNVALGNGTLPNQAFEAFLRQDRFYLKDYSYALKHLAPRFSNKSHQLLCKELSKYVFKEIPFLYDYASPPQTPTFFQPARALTIKSTPVSNYTRFLLNNAKNKPVGIAVASLLPCFYLYSELGNHMKRQAQPNNPYHAWIKSYSNDAFLSYTQHFIEMLNELEHEITTLEEEERMITAFVQATTFEIAFWDSLYLGYQQNASRDLDFIYLI